jgi:hypothetical protein
MSTGASQNAPQDHPGLSNHFKIAFNGLQTHLANTKKHLTPNQTTIGWVGGIPKGIQYTRVNNQKGEGQTIDRSISSTHFVHEGVLSQPIVHEALSPQPSTSDFNTASDPSIMASMGSNQGGMKNQVMVANKLLWAILGPSLFSISLSLSLFPSLSLSLSLSLSI